MKNLLRELILPSFWLIIFITTSNTEVRVNKLKKAENTQLKKEYMSVSVKVNSIEKNKESKFINPIYLTGF